MDGGWGSPNKLEVSRKNAFILSKWEVKTSTWLWLGRPAPEAEEPVPGGEEERRSIASTASMVSIVSIASLDQWFPFCTTTGPPSPAVPPTPQPRRRLYLPLTQNKGIFSALLQFVR